MRHIDDIARRFGIPAEVLGRYSGLVDQDTVFIGTPEVMKFDAVRPMRRGIRLSRIFPHSVKPTTFALQVLGRHATRNVVDVEDEQVKALINGGSLRIEAEVDDGFVLIRWKGFAVGIGHYRRPNLRSQIPRIRSVE
jgi:NOL1/NOP2/fmu family ribosome biogenesis protein